MAFLRAKKEINKNKHGNGSSISIVDALPKDLLVQIVGKIASRSMGDLCKVKLSCKDFLKASEDGYVYQHAKMDNFALVPLPWFKGEKETSFLRRCRENGNLEIFYREGMVQYFSSTLMVNLGLENLKKAALEGHHEAKYVYSMLLMANYEDEEGRKLGFDLFAELKNSMGVVASCRKRVKSFIRSMWVKNRVVVPNQGMYLCQSNSCQRNGTEKMNKHSTWYAAAADDEIDNDCTSCKYCVVNYELGLFCNMFRV